jgi:hypothetical protein
LAIRNAKPVVVCHFQMARVAIRVASAVHAIFSASENQTSVQYDASGGAEPSARSGFD